VIPAEQTYLSQCPSCYSQIDVTALEPFAKLQCPNCQQSVRVRRQFDHFLIIKQIGEGGMSRVFEAEDQTLGRRVALKILNRTYSGDSVRMAQFQQEGLLTAQVTHANVIKLYSVGFDQGHYFIAMELVNGGSLEARIRKEGSVPEKDALRIGRQVAEGLRAAHRIGLLHRDVKPANILFTEDGTAKVVDFGLALFVNRKDESNEIWATPYYVSPEKVIENEEDFRSDLFSLGATLYHALTGQPPHKVNNVSMETLRMLKCRRVSLEDCGRPFAHKTTEVIDRLVAFKPEDRPNSYDEAVDQLRLAEGLTGRIVVSTMSLRRKLVFGAVAAIGLAYSLGWLISGGDAPTRAKADSPLVVKDLIGEGQTVSADKRTIADRFLSARKALTSGAFADAQAQFSEIINRTPKQPTLNWARFNSALCAIVQNHREEAAGLFADILHEPGAASETYSPFFAKLGTSMSKGLALTTPSSALNYGTANEEALGYVAHGLAHWHLGQPNEASNCLSKFLASRQGDPTLRWLDEYRVLLSPYVSDLNQLAAWTRTQAAKPSPHVLLEEAERLLKELKTRGKLRQELESTAASLKKSIVNDRLAQQRSEIKAQVERRNVELDQLKELNKSLPSLVQGYDYSAARQLLADIQFETPELQNAINAKRYLYQGADDFLAQVFSDLKSKGWLGKIQVRGQVPTEGKIINGTEKELTLSLGYGTRPVPLEIVTAETLFDVGQTFFQQTRDSTESFRRQELLILFAHIHGLSSQAAEQAEHLSRDHVGFRSRWLKVLQSNS
jgi:tetratricopeptide (TPR) repeat protein